MPTSAAGLGSDWHVVSWETPYDFRPRITAYAAKKESVTARIWKRQSKRQRDQRNSHQRAQRSGADASMPSAEDSSQNTKDHAGTGEKAKTSSVSAEASRYVVVAPPRGRPFSASHGGGNGSSVKSDMMHGRGRFLLVRRKPSPPKRASSADGKDDTSAHETHTAVGRTRAGPYVPAPPPPREEPEAHGGTTTTAAAGATQSGPATVTMTPHAPADRRAVAAWGPAPPAQRPSSRGGQQQRRRAPAYRPRVCGAYALPPTYAADQQRLARGAVPHVVIESSAASRCDGAPPLNVMYLHDHAPNAHYGRTRRALYEDVRRAAPFALSAELYQHLCPEAAAAGGDYNFNAIRTQVYEGSYAERVARLMATEARMRERLIGGVVPLAEAFRFLSDAPADDSAAAAEGENGEEGGGVAAAAAAVADSSANTRATQPVGGVLDDGYIDGRIQLVHPRARWATPQPPELPPDATAVVVHPLLSEVAALTSSPEAVARAEFRRGLPKGREWDRQYAIRMAVGATAQEALIDLQIDPRYRRPGEKLFIAGRGS